jgi:dipeptidyl aminopeptidase/acylaminoacyl peptidase
MGLPDVWRREVTGAGSPLALVPLTGTGLASLTIGALMASAGYIVQQLTDAPPRQRRLQVGLTPWELGIPFEEVCFPAEDGSTLRGWLLTRPESARVIVGLHGYRGRRSDLLGVAAALWRGGYQVLLFDCRGHGDSDGQRVTLGYAETRDFHAALAWLRRRLPGAWIGVLGYSMGGAVALLGAAGAPDVRAVATDCAFCRQEELIRAEWQRRLHLPATPVVELAEQLLLRLHGFRYRDVDPLAVVGRLAPRPLLLIHSAADTVVPVGDAYRLYEAAGEGKELWIIDGVPHCCGYFADRAGYCARLLAFFDRAASLSGGVDDAPPRRGGGTEETRRDTAATDSGERRGSAGTAAADAAA